MWEYVRRNLQYSVNNDTLRITIFYESQYAMERLVQTGCRVYVSAKLLLSGAETEECVRWVQRRKKAVRGATQQDTTTRAHYLYRRCKRSRVDYARRPGQRGQGGKTENRETLTHTATARKGAASKRAAHPDTAAWNPPGPAA